MAGEWGEGVAYAPYGGKSIHEQSHGEGFLNILESRLGTKGIYILDEPEAALSPAKQMALLSLIRQAEKRGDAQIIMATHSPIIMSYPYAQLFEISGGDIVEKKFKETSHYNLYSRFISNPEKYHEIIFEE